MPIYIFLISGLVAYPSHQAVQSIGSTATHHPSVPPKSLLGKAIQYTLNHWDKLIVYIEAGFLKPDNNVAENAIRPFVLGRKNWLFAGAPKGAEASATFFSLIETAKANGLEPYGVHSAP